MKGWKLKEKKQTEIIDYLVRTIEIVILFIGYIVLWKSNKANDICLRAYRFLAATGIYVVMSILILWKEKVNRLLKEVLPGTITKIMQGLLCVLMPAISLLTLEIACNDIWRQIPWCDLVANYVILFICGAVMVCIFGNIRVGLMLEELISFVYGTVNHYVLMFKDAPLRPGELLSAKTGMAVAGGYEYHLTNGIVISAYLCVFSLLLIYFFTSGVSLIRRKNNLFYIVKRAAYIVMGCMLLYLPYEKVNCSEQLRVSIDEWRPGETYNKVGSPLCFVIDCQKMKIEKPAGYSTKEEEAKLSEYTSGLLIDDVKKPNIIVIMNESFADLSVLGKFESEDYLSRWNSVTDYIQKGFGYASVKGGGTCNTEFEFLTGNSMAFLPPNMFPYQILNFSHVENMAGILKNNGYTTIAMHPETATNWNRKKVYTQMGFDDFITKENGYENADLWKKRVTDWSDYQEIIRQMEMEAGPVFIFNVTMQNHSEYSTWSIRDEDIVQIEEKYQKYDDVVAYLSGVKQSDLAFGKLLEYLRYTDEDVILCMFGDHTPKLNGDFIKDIREADTENQNHGDIDLYKVPYMIWSNYMEPEELKKDVSFNYLSSRVLELVGIQTPYTQYLLDLEKEIPIIYSLGYFEQGGWKTLDEKSEALSELSQLAYYQLFKNNQKNPG